MAGLLVAEQVAGAADLEVAHRDLEAGAELGVVATVLTVVAPRPGSARRRTDTGDRRRRALAAAAHAPADLVQLREAERVRALDDQRVRLRDVDPRLDDAGATRARPRRLAGTRACVASSSFSSICPWATSNFIPGHSARSRSAVSSIDSIRLCRKNAWPLALVLAEQRALDQLLVVLADVGLDRPPALGRRLDHADVADPGHRHLERARDRRGAHRDHVDLQLELAEQLLLLDAEPLLLVDDQEAEILRADVAGQQAVRADEDVDLARRRSA